jgi:hypothetical protein
MRVEDKRCQAQRKRRDPEVDEVRDPQCDRDIQQHNRRAHAQVDTWASKTRVEDAGWVACRCKGTPGSNVTSSTKRPG